MISGYSRNTTVLQNEFYLVGENGVVSWGYTADFPDAQRTVPIPATQGAFARRACGTMGVLCCCCALLLLQRRWVGVSRS